MLSTHKMLMKRWEAIGHAESRLSRYRVTSIKIRLTTSLWSGKRTSPALADQNRALVPVSNKRSSKTEIQERRSWKCYWEVRNEEPRIASLCLVASRYPFPIIRLVRDSRRTNRRNWFLRVRTPGQWHLVQRAGMWRPHLTWRDYPTKARWNNSALRLISARSRSPSITSKDDWKKNLTQNMARAWWCGQNPSHRSSLIKGILRWSQVWAFPGVCRKD